MMILLKLEDQFIIGFTFDFSIHGKVAFTIIEYLEDIIVEAPEDLKNHKNAQYPDNQKLLKVDDESLLLSTKKADIFLG